MVSYSIVLLRRFLRVEDHGTIFQYNHVKKYYDYIYVQLWKLPEINLVPELQIRGGIEDNSKIFFLISHRKHVVVSH